MGKMADPAPLGTLHPSLEGGVTHHFPVQVYWEDTDAGGIVYYANYLKFTERARTDLLRSIGIEQQRLMHEDGLNFVVRDCKIEYLLSAKLDDTLRVETTIGDIKGATLRMYQDVFLKEQLLVRSEVRVACLQKSGRPARFSPQIRDKFAKVANASGAMKK
jgi:acyl-CoA thioester hydrolase